MMDQAKSNLFVYGSLREPMIFKSVSGFGFTFEPSRVGDETLFAESALLGGYRRVSPDNVYFYAVADPSSKIEGFLVYDVPATAMNEIDNYEGKRYDRETVSVNTATGAVSAQAYLVSHEAMREHFGDRWHVNLIHELWLRKRIEKFLEKHTRPGEHTHDAELERRAERELLGTTERDLVISHYHADAISDYFLEHELDRPRPSIKHLYHDGEVRPFLENYLRLIVKQVLLNQFDEKIQSDYRFQLEHIQRSERYFKRSVSLLAALRMINAVSQDVGRGIEAGLETMKQGDNDLIDYVKYGVSLAETIFDWRLAGHQLRYIQANLRYGVMPIGAEIELSNIGYKAVAAEQRAGVVMDKVYNSFKYFCDFHLHVLTWKLGGYIDDHTGSTDISRRQGFLELAPGRLNIEGQISRPATSCPWLMSQLIQEITAFYDVAPHSLHLSFQLRKNQLKTQQVLPLGFVKCLLVLGGGLQQKDTGRLWVSRLGYDEITQYNHQSSIINHQFPELVFARTSRRQWYLGEDEIGDRAPRHATKYVQQYKFIRLDRRANYEPLILCLKGLQSAYNPADYLTAEQLAASKKLRGQYNELKKWGTDPTPISWRTISGFLNIVRLGLMTEFVHRPAHKLHYIDWAISSIDVQLRMFNKQRRKIKL